MFKIDFNHDWESRSYLDLSVVGPVRYWTHPSTQGTRFTYSFGRTGPVKIWRPLTEPVPADLVDVALHPEKYNFIAWNVLFDYLAWICFMSKLVPGLVRPPLENIHDAMALSCHYRTGASLEACATFMNLPINKDPEGRRIMLKQCKPDKTGRFPLLTPQEEASFDYYSITDTKILREVYYMLPPLPGPERYAWEWTFRRNLEGICIDMMLVHELKAIVDSALPSVTNEFEAIVGCKINSHVKVKEYFKKYYPWIRNMRAETMRDLLIDDTPVPPEVRRALELKDLAGGSAVSKLTAAVDLVYNGRIFELLAYHQAQTKRWAGRGIQIQNFPRVRKQRPDSLKFDMNVHDLAATVRALRPTLKDPMGFVTNLLRRIWIPTPGTQFYCGDFAKVEPSVLFWLTDMGPIPKLWYEEMAAAIYNRQVSEIEDGSQERTVGKMANLSCQYGTGAEGYRKSVYKDTGIALSKEEAKLVVFTYRQKNPKIVQFWADLESGFRRAVYGETVALCRGRIHIMPLQTITPRFKGVAIRLPSGSFLYYHQAHEYAEVKYVSLNPDPKTGEKIELEPEQFNMLAPIYRAQYGKRERTVLRYLSDAGQGRVEWKYVYGGLLCENVTSGTARDILIPSTWHLEQAGFNILGLIHDEIWAETRAGREEEFKRLMCINPSWCDMEIGSDLKCGVRYLK